MRRTLIGPAVIVLALAACGSTTPATRRPRTVTVNGLGPMPASPEGAAAKARRALEDISPLCKHPSSEVVLSVSTRGRRTIQCVERDRPYRHVAEHLKCAAGYHVKIDLKHRWAKCVELVDLDQVFNAGGSRKVTPATLEMAIKIMREREKQCRSREDCLGVAEPEITRSK